MSFVRYTLIALVLVLAGLDTARAQDEPAQTPESPAAVGAEPVAPLPEPQQPSLEQAYQREFAFLQGQKRDLEQRLARIVDENAEELGALRGELTALENRVVQARTRADQLEDLVFESARAVDVARENADALAATFIQADFTLDDAWTNDLGDRAPTADDVRGLFDAALQFLARGHRVYQQAGEFFLADGTRVQGEIIHAGNVAAWGISDSGSGALAPAGDGELKVWTTESAGAARMLAAGNAPETLPIFLFESLNAEVERKVAKGVMETVNSGGVIGWIIFFLGLLGAVLVVLRVVFLRRASASTGNLMNAISGHIQRGDRSAALEVAKKQSGATARVLLATIRNLDRDREHVEDIVSEAILHENAHLNRFGALIIVIAAVSPLLGLLGTVTGMIATFDVITEFGTGDPKLLSGGISIALVTTELGLIVAIPMLLFGNLLSGWAESIKDDMEKAALRVINLFGHARNVGSAEAAA